MASRNERTSGLSSDVLSTTIVLASGDHVNVVFTINDKVLRLKEVIAEQLGVPVIFQVLSTPTTTAVADDACIELERYLLRISSQKVRNQLKEDRLDVFLWAPCLE